jgi:hypothetical protein
MGIKDANVFLETNCKLYQIVFPNLTNHCYTSFLREAKTIAFISTILGLQWENFFFLVILRDAIRQLLSLASFLGSSGKVSFSVINGTVRREREEN